VTKVQQPVVMLFPGKLSAVLCWRTFETRVLHSETASVVYWSEFLAANPEVLGSIHGTARFSE
jgi:hypothetical protein